MVEIFIVSTISTAAIKGVFRNQSNNIIIGKF